MRSQWSATSTEMGSTTDGQSGLARRRWDGGKENEMNGSIVCGVDESADSQAALGVAARLAERLDARLVLAHVAEFAPSHMPTMMSATTDGQKKAGERLLDQVAEEAGLPNAAKRAVVGFPAERLADLADEEDAELIVVGSRGRGRFKAAFLGSVSNSLVGVARCRC
jgi:nucleotide-binding universal stress UspA family protein